jgi:putative hydrolase of the HAD superfamily
MIPSGIRAIFFDAVGTLIHPEPPAPTVYAAVGRRHGSRLTEPEIAARFLAAFARHDAQDMAAGLRTSEHRERQRWRDVVGEVLDDVSDKERCFEELFGHFGRPEAWRGEPGIEDVLNDLRHSYVVGVASNYDARLHSVLRGLPQFRRVQHVIISSEVGWRKPAPQFFRALCVRVGLRPGEMLFVGDDPVNDYGGATAAGLSAALIAKGVTGTAQMVRTLLQLPKQN